MPPVDDTLIRDYELNFHTDYRGVSRFSERPQPSLQHLLNQTFVDLSDTDSAILTEVKRGFKHVQNQIAVLSDKLQAITSVPAAPLNDDGYKEIDRILKLHKDEFKQDLSGYVDVQRAAMREETRGITREVLAELRLDMAVLQEQLEEIWEDDVTAE
jgi:uncharacterized coiled-coil protein SlyX